MAPETGEGPLPSRVSFHSRPFGALLYPSSSADAGAGATAAVTAEQVHETASAIMLGRCSAICEPLVCPSRL